MTAIVHRSGFVALIGPANAGKSTLLNRLVGRKLSIVSPRPQTTRHRILGVLTRSEAQLVFLDTPGFFRERTPSVRFSLREKGEMGRFLGHVMRTAAEEVDLSLLVLDARDLIRAESVPPLSDALRRVALPKLIALNKIDLVQKDALLPLMESLYCEFSDARGDPVEIIPISALEGDGVELLKSRLIENLPFGPRLFPEDYVTDQTDEFLAQEIIREKLFLRLGEEVPYSTAVRVDEMEISESLLTIQATVFIERSSQRGIVIGRKGERLKEIGTSARQELERIFGEHVFLRLFVRVEERWTQSQEGLRRVGL